MTISKHKNVESVKSYWQDTTVEQKCTMALALSKSLGLDKDNIPEKTDQEDQVSVGRSLKEDNMSGELYLELSQNTYDKMIASDEIVPFVDAQAPVTPTMSSQSPPREISKTSSPSVSFERNDLKATSALLGGATFYNCSINFNLGK